MASNHIGYFESEPFVLAEGRTMSTEKVCECLAPLLTRERVDKIEKVIKKRDLNVIPVLENIYDRGNISAVMRSAEAFGFLNFNIISPSDKFKNSNRVTQGAEKWLNVKEYSQTKVCVSELREKGFRIYATDLNATKSIDEIDFSHPSAIVFGNEKEGISQEMAELADERIIIPMSGFIQSFNISVAAALSFYHVHQARKAFRQEPSLAEQSLIRANYYYKSVSNPKEILKNGL